jgi:hypothetical protein
VLLPKRVDGVWISELSVLVFESRVFRLLSVPIDGIEVNILGVDNMEVSVVRDAAGTLEDAQDPGT